VGERGWQGGVGGERGESWAVVGGGVGGGGWREVSFRGNYGENIGRLF
jgi:hypothetical protein